jgi:hypothetical protein
LSPRWQAAQVPSAEVTVRYPASAGYCSYTYRGKESRIEVDFTGSAESFEVQILLPPHRRVQTGRLDGQQIVVAQRNIEESSYLVLPAISFGVHSIEVDLA